MRKVILHIISIFGLSFALVFVYFFLFFKIVPSQNDYSYETALLDKVNRLTSINEPKIILVGNSNLAFGMDSRLVEEEFDMPVVNLGLHGGLGNKFIEQIAKLNINEGDIVIICHTEYTDKVSDLDAELAWRTIANHYELWKALKPEDWLVIMKGLPDYTITTTAAWLNHAGNTIPEGAYHYQRLAFNEEGDNVYPRDSRCFEPEPNAEEEKMSEISGNTVTRLNRLNDYCQDNKATMLIAAYPIIDDEYRPSGDEIAEFTEKLKDRMNCDVISDYTEYIMDESLFYDTKLHLNNEGAKKRTLLLISDLKKYFDENSTHNHN